MINVGEEFYTNDMNLKLAKINIAKKEGMTDKDLLDNYFEILEV